MRRVGLKEKARSTAFAFVAAFAFACGVFCVGGCRSAGEPYAEEYGGLLQTVLYGQPQEVSVSSNGLRSAELTWAAPVEKTYRYRIERAPAIEGPFALVAEVSSRHLAYTDGATPATRLNDSTAYYYRVTAVLEKNGPFSQPSPVVMTVTAPPPVPPLNVRAAASGSRAVTVAWDASASQDVTTYRVERAPSDAPAAFEKVAAANAISIVDGGTPASTLKDSTDYLYRVVSVNRVDAESVPSEAVRVTTLPPPKPVQGLAAVSREVRCVPLTWAPSPEADVVHYDIYQAREAEGPFQKIGSARGRTTTQFTDGGANPGTLEDEGSYFYRVRAVNAVTAESADSATVRAVTREVPPEVRQVALVSARPREVPVSWAASPDTSVVGYEVWRATGDEDDWVQVARLNSRDSTSFMDRGGEKDGTRLGQLKDGTEYQYRVIAFNTANVRSSASAPVKARTKVIPVAPTGLTATTNLAHTVRLTWQPNPEKDVNGYLIGVSKKPDDGFRKLTVVRGSEGVALTADETELDPGVTHYYRIKALDKEGLEGEWSQTVSGRSKPLPDAPTGLQSLPDGAAVRITWQPPPQTDITQYNVWEKKLFGWRLVAATPRPEYRLEPAADEKTPTLAVTAVDQDKLESQRSEPLKP